MASRIAGFGLAISIGLIATPAAPAAAQTAVVVFRPWSHGKLDPGYTISRRLSGSCWTHSIVSDRTDAWRCRNGNDVYDPCFGGGSKRVLVACGIDPFSKLVVVLTLTRPVRDKESATARMLQPKGEPWGIRLAGGDRCVFVTGATDSVGDERLNYACHHTGWIIGATGRSNPTWTARSVEWPKTHVTVVRIETAIF